MTVHPSTDWIAKEIARLIPKAESGEQWAEICRLEAEMLAAGCACGNGLITEQEQRNGVCRECL